MFEEIKHALDTFVHPGGVVEIRVLKGARVRENGGFFDDLTKAANTAHMLDQAGEYEGIYFTLNRLDPDLLARYNNKMCQKRNPDLTKESNIIHRDWLLVDLDIEAKLSGISSKESEHTEAIAESVKFRDRMTADFGWPQPVRADSGNGAHLLYKIDLPNTKESTELVKKTLEALDYVLDHPRLKIDSAPHDPNRICKLYGTMTRKGDELGDRKHRRSCLLEVPEEIVILPADKLKELVGLHEQAVGPKEPEPQPFVGGAGLIGDMGQWLTDHKLEWSKQKGAQNGGTRYVLTECPGCHNRDNCCDVTKFKPPRDGQSAACKHESCKIKSWEDFRKIVEPEYYEAREKRQSRQEVDQNRRVRKDLPDLDIEDICNSETVNEGKPNESIKYTYSPDKAADAIIQRWDVVSTKDETVWVYGDGYYRPDAWTSIDATIDRIAGDRYNTRQSKETWRKVYLRTLAEEDPFNKNPYLLVCKNCTINLETSEVLEHSPAHYVNSPSAFVYNPEARPEAFLQLLEESCFNNIDRLTLVDWLVATCCLVSFEFILFLTGSGSNGKRLYEDVLHAMFPKATEGVGLDELNKERFARAQLRYARTNIFNETNVNEAATEIIKSLSGGDHQSGDVKNARMRALWRSFIQLIFDTNSAPRFADNSYGFKRRFTRVKMPFTFVDHPDPEDEFQKKADPTLGERLVSEENMSGILNMIIVRAPEIVKLRRICRRENDYDEYEKDAHSFRRFVEEFIEFNPMRREDKEYQTPAPELYANFEEFVKLGGAPMSRFTFSGKIGKLNKQTSTTLRPPVEEFGKKVFRGFKGLKFKEERFKQFILAEKASILSSNGFNDSVTSIERVDTDTVTSVTRYRGILVDIEKNKGTLYKKSSEFGMVVTGLVTNQAADSENGTLGSEVKIDSRSLENRVVADPVAKPQKVNTKKKNLVCLRITADCEADGKKYRKDEVVNVEPAIQKQLCGVIIEEFVHCAACGKAVKPFVRNGRESLCQECFKRGCPQMNGYMHMALHTETCKFCGNQVKRGELFSQNGECEACYFSNIGMSKVKMAAFGCGEV